MAATQTPPTTTQAHRTVFVETFTDGLLGPDVADGGAGGRRRPHRRQHDPGLLGADDHAVDPRRPRGLHAGGGGRGRGRRRHRHPHPRHRGDLDGHELGQRPADGGALQRRPVLRAGLPGLRHRVAADAAWRASGPRACAAPTAAPTRRPSPSPTATRSPSTRREAWASPSGARRPSASPATRHASRRCPTARRRTRSSASPRTTSSRSPRACGRSWASSAPPRRRRSPTRTTRATSAPSSSARRTASR